MTAFFCSRVRSATGTLNFPCTSCNRLWKASSLKGLRYFPFALSPFRPFANTVFEQKETYKECDTFILKVQLCNCISL